MRTHRLIPSRFPPVALFEWADSPEKLEKLALIEGLTNSRLMLELGDTSLVPREDWVLGPGSSILMAPFTHPGPSRFTSGSFGIYYAGDTLDTAIAETKYHRERFLRASKEGACFTQMREYIANVTKPLETLSMTTHAHLLHPDPLQYQASQSFGETCKTQNVWGLHYPSVRKENGQCVAIFRAPALTVPSQGCHLEYIWDGKEISEVRQSILHR